MKNRFEQALLLSFDTLDPIREAATAVYNEFLRKLCNTRLAEFMDCFRQVQAVDQQHCQAKTLEIPYLASILILSLMWYSKKKKNTCFRIENVTVMW